MLSKGNDLVPITSAFQCAFERDMHNFVEISNVPRSKVSGGRQGPPTVAHGFAPFPSMFGDGVVLSTTDNHNVSIKILSSADSELSNLATTLLNDSKTLGLHFTIHGRDTHYFVKSTIQEAKDDIGALRLRDVNLISDINVTIHTHRKNLASDNPNDNLQFVDIRLHSYHTVINLRYGTTPEQEKERVLRHAHQRAVEHAWVQEKRAAINGLQTIHSWNAAQKETLLEHNKIAGVRAVYIHDISHYPELADSASNIQFITPEASR